MQHVPRAGTKEPGVFDREADSNGRVDVVVRPNPVGVQWTSEYRLHE